MTWGFVAARWCGFVFDGWDVPYCTVEPSAVVPVGPFGGGELDVREGLPGASGLMISVLNRPIVAQTPDASVSPFSAAPPG